MDMAVTPTELLARFLLSRSLFSREKRTVKSSAFMPPPSGELSVFRIEGLSAGETWELGERHVARPQQRRLHGRADMVARAVTESGLKVNPDDDPPRHATIVGWPDSKDAQKSIALELAVRAKLRLRST